MKSVVTAFGFVAVLAMGSAAWAQTAPAAADCDAWFAKVDANADGKLDATEGKMFVDKINETAATKLDAAAGLEKAAFTDACTKGTLGMPTP